VTDWRKLDPRVLAIRPVEGLTRAAIPLLVIFFSGQRRDGPGQWISLAFAVLVVLVGISHWFTTKYRIADGQVQLRTGLLRRRHLAVPLDRVRSVDVTASPMHRLLGVAVVKIGTGRHDKGKRDELRLDAISARDAAALRAELLHREAAAPEQTPDVASAPTSVSLPVPLPPDEILSAFDPAWVRFAPFTLSGVATVGAVTGYVFHLLNEAHIDPGKVGEVRTFADFLSRTPLPLVAVLLLAVLLLLASALSTVGYLLAFWGFRLTRHPGGSLHVQRGLLTSRSVSLEERRLRGVDVREPLLLRLVSGARLLVIATGMRENRGSDKGGELLQPPAPVAQAHRVARLVLRGVDPTTAPLRAHGPAARRRRYLRALAAACALLAALVVVRLAGGPNWPWWAAALLLPLAWLVARDRYGSLGHAVVGGYLVTRHGSLDRRTAALRTDGIIGWRIHQSYFQRRAGLVTLIATTSGGHGAYHVPDVPLADALACAEAAVPGLLAPWVTGRDDANRLLPQRS
jgi:putative membrane protein